MNRHTAITTASILCALLMAQGCLKDETLDTNRLPIARAKAVGSTGDVIDDTSSGDGLLFPFEGNPVEVTLDGTASTDLDGKVASYDWRYVAPESDAGAPENGFWNQNPALDPKNSARPKVTLPMGSHTFTLWVTDDGGAISEPDSITIRVGGDPVQECVDGAHEQLDDMCRQCLCSQSGACQTAVPMCDSDCWGLIGCIATSCPDYMPGGDPACLLANCTAYLTPTGMSGAMAAGSCVMPCSAQCTASIIAIISGD